MSFQVEWQGLDEFEAQMRKGPEIVKDEMLKGVNRLTFAGQSISQAAAPVDTGTLRRSIIAKPATFAGGEAKGQWGTNVPYAKYQEYGTRRGIKPKGFMKKGADEITPKVAAEFKRVAAAIVARMGGG